MARKEKRLDLELASLIEQHGWREVLFKLGDLVGAERLGITNDDIEAAEGLKQEIRRVLRSRDIKASPVFNSLGRA